MLIRFLSAFLRSFGGFWYPSRRSVQTHSNGAAEFYLTTYDSAMTVSKAGHLFFAVLRWCLADPFAPQFYSRRLGSRLPQLAVILALLTDTDAAMLRPPHKSFRPPSARAHTACASSPLPSRSSLHAAPRPAGTFICGDIDLSSPSLSVLSPAPNGCQHRARCGQD
ncbi:hypothetical protein R3P38DRAFT_3240000 [Favolaschia claudopus]|uniref:Uncharacterized protein n=1 Tax=Favolaschia claudopus TaxID=2862362 RepID=A0AAV9Z6W5_9AGAR